MKKNKLFYESPSIEIIEVLVEQGFSLSVGDGAFDEDSGDVVTPPF